MKNFTAALGFSVFSGIGPIRFKLLVEYFGSAQKAWNAPITKLKSTGLSEKRINSFDQFRQKFDSSHLFETLEKKKIWIITQEDKKYPKPLQEIPDPPIVLYVKGNPAIEIDWNLAIAIVGTRRMSSYGRTITSRISADLASAGCPVISGMAYGIDAVAHSSAIENNGKTIAVLGCGVDIISPVSNSRLYGQIVAGGGWIVSEYPPGKLADKTTFPARNRIISGLSRGVVVTEAPLHSGALITARFALEQNREVFAVPGPVTSINSEGTLELIKHGAIPVAGAFDVLSELKIHKTLEIPFNKNDSSDSWQRKILDLLSRGDCCADDISRETGVSVKSLISILTMMELKDEISRKGQGLWGRK